MKAVSNDVEKAGKSAEKTKKQMNSMFSGVERHAKRALTAVAAFIGAQGLGALIDRSKQIGPVTSAFEALSQQIDSTATEFLPKMQQATRGLLTDLDLMIQANNAVTLGVATSAEQYSELTGNAIKLGKALGVDAKNAIESITVGIGRQSKLWLDNLGIIIDTQKAYDDYAASLGKTSKQLTDAEKKLAFNEAATTALREAVSKLGPETLTAGDAVQQLQTNLVNMLDKFVGSQGFNVALNTAVDLLKFVADNIQLVVDAAIAFVAVKFGEKIWGMVEALRAGEIAGKGMATALRSIGLAAGVFAGIELVRVFLDAAKAADDYREALDLAKKSTDELSKAEIQRARRALREQESVLRFQLQQVQDLQRMLAGSDPRAGIPVVAQALLPANLRPMIKSVGDLNQAIKFLERDIGRVDKRGDELSEAFFKLKGKADELIGESGGGTGGSVSGGKGLTGIGKMVAELNKQFGDLGKAVGEAGAASHLEDAAKASDELWKSLGLLKDEVTKLGNALDDDVLTSITLDSLDDVMPPSRFRGLGDDMADAFTEGFTQTLRSLADTFDAIGVGIGASITKGLNKSLKITGGIAGAFTGVFGALIGGGIGSILGGLFGGGGDGGAARAARMAEMQRKWQEETNRLTQEFIETLKELVDIENDAVIWTAELKSQIFELKQRGVDMSEAFKLVEDAIKNAELAVANMEDQLQEIPRTLDIMFVAMDDLRRARADIQDQIKDTKDALLDLATGPKRFAEAKDELKRAQDELIAAEKDGNEARIKSAREWVATAEAALSDVESLQAGISFSGRTGRAGRRSIISGIRAARGGDRLRDRRITLREERDLLRQAGNEETRILISQLIAQENALTEAKLRIQVQKETRQATRETKKELRENLPRMRDKLQELRNFAATFDTYWNEQLGLLREIRDKIGPETERGIDAHSGVSFMTNSPMSGEQHVINTHGRELVQVTPRNQLGRVQAPINIIINADNPESFRHWIRNGGDKEIARAVKDVGKIGGG